MMWKNWIRTVASMSALALLAGCMTMPAELNQPVSAVALGDVKAARAPMSGQSVRWGGVIAAVENRNNETWLEIVEQPLNDVGRPRMVDHSAGRFMVKVPGFLDPSIYAKGREFTAVGALDGTYRATIGTDYHYDYPVVASSSYFLWPPRVETETYYVDPVFSGYYGYGPGYWGPYYRGYYGPGWYGPSRYRVDVRRPSDQPGPGPAPSASSGGHSGANPPPLPTPPSVSPAPEPASPAPAKRESSHAAQARQRIQEPDAPQSVTP